MFVRFVDDNELNEALRQQQERRARFEASMDKPLRGTLVGDTTLMLSTLDIRHSSPEVLRQLSLNYDILTSSPGDYQAMQRKISKLKRHG